MKTVKTNTNKDEFKEWIDQCRMWKIPSIEFRFLDSNRWEQSASYAKECNGFVRDAEYRIPKQHIHLIKNPCSEIPISNTVSSRNCGKTFFDVEWLEKESFREAGAVEGVRYWYNDPNTGMIFQGVKVDRDDNLKTGESKKMSKFERKVYINEREAVHLSDDNLIQFITDAEAQVKALRTIKTSSETIETKIEELYTYLEEVAEYLDERNANV